MKKDKIIINDKTTIRKIQEDFHKMFPYLKIEFNQGPSKRNANLVNKTLGEHITKHNKAFMDINQHTTVTELGRAFNDRYNLDIEVYRHSGNAWLKTSKTNYWTLEQQNKLGEELSKSGEEIKM